MNPLKKLAALTGFILIGLSQIAAADVEPYPLDYFALRAVENNVTVSPGGKYLALLRIIGKQGNPILHIYDINDLDKDPFVVNSDPMEITSYYWADDEYIVMTMRQRVRDLVKGQEETVYSSRIAILDVANEEFDDFDAVRPAVVNLMRNVPGKIIISEQPTEARDLQLEAAFRPRQYYIMNLENGAKQLLIKGKWSLSQVEFDADGNPRAARGFDRGERDYTWYYRDPGSNDWIEMKRVSEDNTDMLAASFYPFFVGFDDAVPGNILVMDFNGDDKRGLWSYNPKTQTYDELLYRRSDVDVYGVRMHSNRWTYPDRVAAVSYFKDNFHSEYFDEIEGATYHQLEQLIPYAHYVSITSRSRDGNSLVAYNTGPQDPGTYYLLHNGEFKEIASAYPLFDKEDLAEVEYFNYKARDGYKLAGFITIPKIGKPPYPTVIMPHGGPHVLEVVLYHEWAQMLANNGYLVIQPQFRMSMGYGMQHNLVGWVNGSEAGRMMQDDKDDAVIHLIEEGMVDPDRVAMYGWSYGGYAALIAASRTPQLYQCTIAGAAVSSYIQSAIDGTRGFEPSGIGKIWIDVYERGAVQPVEEVDKVNVPILLIHGSVDSRVMPNQAKLYRKALDKAGKYYKYVELDGADHFSNTLFYDHQKLLFESIIDFLATECGTMSGGALQASAESD
ncbi:MAG: prolyl oligopeptidase family serine peptidase [Woeseiaceae bacterium]|nr:prolyl oligopeptidase family serine peptidase [Woeseiaceae bacterium]NIP21046.1 prolyl oligopeptidase family serine peptidase [Woeseiaceae bacterium]